MGPRHPAANKSKSSQDGSYGAMRYAASSMPGWKSWDDSAYFAQFNIAQDTHLFAVFDGHGGRQASRFASHHFADELIKTESFQMGNYKKALADTFLKVDDLLRSPEGIAEMCTFKMENSVKVPVETFSGSTAVMALIVKDTLYIANLGDARGFIVSKGNVFSLSTEKIHMPTNEKEKERIEKAGGRIINRKIGHELESSRAIGDFKYKSNSELAKDEQIVIAVPEIREWKLSKDDEYIILESKGIFSCFPDEEVYDFIRKKVKQGKSLELAIKALFEYLVDPEYVPQRTNFNMIFVAVDLKAK